MKHRLLKAFILNAVFLIGSLHAGLELKWGLSARQGGRDHMEDRHVHILNFDENADQAFFGVYDGHGGTAAANYTDRNLHRNFLKVTGSVEGRLKAAIKKTDEDFLATRRPAGTTAVVAFIDGKKLHLGWLSDSRAVLESAGTVQAATEDHNLQTDRERLESEGYPVVPYRETHDGETQWTLMRNTRANWEAVASVLPKYQVAAPAIGQYYYLWNQDFEDAIYAVGRNINVSRSIGDEEVKNITDPDLSRMLSNEADVKSIDLTTRNGFLILACDGVWDVMNNDEAVRIVSAALAEQKTTIDPDPLDEDEYGEEDGNDVSVQYAARALRDAALEKESDDNISAIVVKFDWTDDEE